MENTPTWGSEALWKSAKELDLFAKRYTEYLNTCVGLECLYLYVKTTKRQWILDLGDTWQGWPLHIRKSGRAIAFSEGTDKQ